MEKIFWTIETLVVLGLLAVCIYTNNPTRGLELALADFALIATWRYLPGRSRKPSR